MRDLTRARGLVHRKSAIKVEGLLFGAHVSQGFTDDVRGQTSFRPRESFEHRPIKEPVEKQLQSMHFPEIEESEWIGGEHQVLQTTDGVDTADYSGMYRMSDESLVRQEEKDPKDLPATWCRESEFL
ncbi:hypothetical protein DFH09DRAFT_1115501 [Mycena vulgaris]|nr:hypothetical protein DFH09DRAFT_1115501 [Mycena vulgaris]